MNVNSRKKKETKVHLIKSLVVLLISQISSENEQANEARKPHLVHQLTDEIVDRSFDFTKLIRKLTEERTSLARFSMIPITMLDLSPPSSSIFAFKLQKQ